MRVSLEQPVLGNEVPKFTWENSMWFCKPVDGELENTGMVYRETNRDWAASVMHTKRTGEPMPYCASNFKTDTMK